MSDRPSLAAPVAASSPLKKAAKIKDLKRSAAKPKSAKSSHPPASDMVNSAIVALKERNGSSLQAIKKYIAATYLVDPSKQSTFIKKYLKAAVEKGTLMRTKGTGAAGSFKLAGKGEAPKKKAVKPKSPLVKKSVAATKAVTAKKPVAKTPVGEKKAADKKAVKPKASKAKSPSKVKKSGKAPAAKPRTPKPKKVSASKAKIVAKK